MIWGDRSLIFSEPVTARFPVSMFLFMYAGRVMWDFRNPSRSSVVEHCPRCAFEIPGRSAGGDDLTVAQDRSKIHVDDWDPITDNMEHCNDTTIHGVAARVPTSEVLIGA